MLYGVKARSDGSWYRHDVHLWQGSPYVVGCNAYLMEHKPDVGEGDGNANACAHHDP